MNVGTTPLIVQVPEMAPMRKSMRIAGVTSLTLETMSLSKSFQGIL